MASAVDINKREKSTDGWAGLTIIVTADTIETVPMPAGGYEFMEPVAINASGHLAGTAREDFEGVNQRAVLIRSIGGRTSSRPHPVPNQAAQPISIMLVRWSEVPALVDGIRITRTARPFCMTTQTGTTTDIGTLPGYQNSVATAINNVGQVVGYAWLPENEADLIRRAFLYDHRTGVMTDLNELIPQDSGWYLVDAFDINDAGQIVGRGLIGGEMHAFVLTPVP